MNCAKVKLQWLQQITRHCCLLRFQLNTVKIVQPRTFSISTLSQDSRPIAPKYEYRSVLKYQGPVKAAIFDWAGTVVDCGVLAPVKAFVETFSQEGVPISDVEARRPMGMHKRDHIIQILQDEDVLRRWIRVKGEPPSSQDIDRIFSNLRPLVLESIKNYSSVIEGIPATIQQLRSEFDLKIGGTTGYDTPIVVELAKLAAREGYAPDCNVAADEVPRARPFAFMVWLCAIKMNISPIESIVKVDDTIHGVREGLAAGCWSVGVTKTGNYVGVSSQELKNIPKQELEKKLSQASEILYESGAHYVIDTVNVLPAVIRDINFRLIRGEKP